MSTRENIRLIARSPLANEGVRCSYKGKICYNNDQNNTLSKPGSILQNTRACAGNENNTITERTGKVKIR